MENQVDVTPNQQPNAPVLPKYGIFQSLQHMMGAVKRNPVTFGVTLLVSYVVSGIILTLTFLGFASLLLGEFGLLFASFSKILMVLVAGLIIYTLLYALVYAFTVSCIAYSLSDEKYGIGTTLKKALKSTVRVVKVNAWVAVVAYWPIAIAAFLPLLLLGVGSSRLGGSPLALLTPILLLVALIWALIAQLRYALAPYVALFEPEVPVKQTLKRSEQLLKKGGQWFVFKGVILILAIFILLAVATGSNLRQLENSNDNTINAIFIVLSILIEGAMVMLYLNRSRKQDPANAPKSSPLVVLVLAILVALIGFAAYNGKNSDTFGGSFSKEDQQALLKEFDDSKRKTDVKAVAEALESYYNEHGYYPSAADISSTEWVSKNLKQTFGKQTMPLSSSRLTDPEGNLINTPSSDYQYKPSPKDCTQCASFELIAKLDEGGEHKQTSLNNTVKPSSAPTSQAPATSTNPAPQTTTSAKTGKAYETYRIAADGNSAQISPVTTTLSDVSSVEVTIDLQCLGTCQFKLVSDTYSFSNTTTYTSSQQIKYTITGPGEYILYNQFTPNSKFKIKF